MALFWAIAQVLIYLFLIAAVVFHALVIWGATASTSILVGDFIVQLSTNATTQVELELGYIGACVSNPTNGFAVGVNTTSSLVWTCMSRFNVGNSTADDVTSEFIEQMNLGTAPSNQYNTSLTALVESAGQFRAQIVPEAVLIAAFALLIFGGLLSIIPLYFNSPRRQRICDFLLSLSALSVGFSFMLAGATAFALPEVQALLALTGLPNTNSQAILVTVGDRLAFHLRLGIGFAATFVFYIVVISFYRHGGHLNNSDTEEESTGTWQPWTIPVIQQPVWIPLGPSPGNGRKGRRGNKRR